jgi:hypothetical protein
VPPTPKSLLLLSKEDQIPKDVILHLKNGLFSKSMMDSVSQNLRKAESFYDSSKGFINPATPAAAVRCPMLLLIEPTATKRLRRLNKSHFHDLQFLWDLPVE